MRIGIDATCWTNWRGFGRFTRSLITALVGRAPHDYTLFFDSTYARCEGVPASARRIVVGTDHAQSEAISVQGRRTLADMVRMTHAVARERLDVFFCPSIDSYVPVLGSAARVVMVHDLIPELMGAQMLPNRAARWRRVLKTRVAFRQADIVSAGSPYVRRQLGARFHLSEDRLAVIPYGVADAFRPAANEAAARALALERHGLGARYLLHVGGFGPNKNIPGLLEAFARVAAEPRFADVQIVFVGKRDDDAVYEEAREIDRLLAGEALRSRVRMLGFVPDEALVPIYQAARGLVLPSLMEGFGLPALEAVRCGTPAVVTRESPLPDILGDAAISVAPTDANGLVGAMERLLVDDGPRAAARKQSGQHGWDRSADAALEVFRRAVDARQRRKSRSS